MVKEVKSWKCETCGDKFAIKKEAMMCEKHHEKEAKKAKKQHQVESCVVEVTWRLKCAKCGEKFTVEGEWGRGGIDPLVQEDEANDTFFTCSECSMSSPVNFTQVMETMW